MKMYFSLLVATLLSFASFGQDRTPVLSEMGGGKPESAALNEPVLAERDTVVVIHTEKRDRVRKMRRKAALSEASKAEALKEE